MLLKVDLESHLATREAGQRLSSFGLNERDLQDILFRSLDKLLPDDELLLITQSRNWQEEPDLMAFDKNGSLYIFELKAWESRSENLLQVLRYGQIYGSYAYDDLERMYGKSEGLGLSLADSHKARFEVDLERSDFNHQQIFVVVTNGLDYRTREAVKYWRSQGLDVRPWVYRAYRTKDEMLLELSPFAVEDNPYEDVAGKYYSLNTNYRNSSTDHEDMLKNKKAAAYFGPWKYKVERLTKGDTVFLYQTGAGVVAVGTASGKLEKQAYHGNPDHAEEEYFMPLERFLQLSEPISAAEVKEVTGNNYPFRGTMFGLGDDSGRKLYQHILGRNNQQG